jgi:hypothetical protein
MNCFGITYQISGSIMVSNAVDFHGTGGFARAKMAYNWRAKKSA